MALVRANGPFATNFNGWPQVVNPGELFDDDDPLVLAHPGNFEPVRAANPVEQATAAPGEQRNVRRPR